MTIGFIDGTRWGASSATDPRAFRTNKGQVRVTAETVSGSESESLRFADFGLIDPLMGALAELGHESPTPIQCKAIGPAIAGRDVLGCAQTGTGKTAAFTLPLLHRLMTREKLDGAAHGRPGLRAQRAPIRALVLSPTRELAAQIDESLGLYGKYCRVSHAMVCGGVGLSSQVRMLQRGVDVLVATPGRLEDLMAQRVVDLSSVEVLILDEVDRMLDQGFLPAVRRITSRIPKGRQTLLFSATMPTELRRLALELMVSPVEVAASQVASTPDTIDQVVYHVASQLKRQMLEHLVSDRDMTRALVFTRTKHGADRVVKHLKAASVGADALHGGKTQSARERALNAFRDGSLRILVATDLAARGIHVDGISHVINFDLPLDADNYVHRIGRTARAGASGKALSLCCAEERDVLHRIEKLIRRRLPVQETPPLLPRPPRVAGSNYTEGDPINRNAMPRPNTMSRDSAGSGQRPRNERSFGQQRRANHSDGKARDNGNRVAAGSGNSRAPSGRPGPRTYRPN